jgi:hypothetical protein
MEMATNRNKPRSNAHKNNKNADKLGGSVRLYGFGKKKETSNIGKHRNKALDSRCAKSFAYQKP